MTTPQNHFEAFLDGVRREGRYRIFTDLERHADRPPYATWRGEGIAREVVVWCSNDYLGMGRHPAVVNAMLETAVRNGAGAGGTRNISGNSHSIVMLEVELADLHRKEAALAFSSGYVSNEAGLGTIGRLLPNCLILSDEKNHASMIAGIRASGAEKRIFRHNDLRPSRGAAERNRTQPPEGHCVRVALLDGWRYRPDRAHLRFGDKIRGADLPRRSACRRSLRPAWRWHCRA